MALFPLQSLAPPLDFPRSSPRLSLLSLLKSVGELAADPRLEDIRLIQTIPTTSSPNNTFYIIKPCYARKHSKNRRRGMLAASG